MIGPVDKWRFQISSAKLVTEGNIPSPVVLARAFLTWQSLETMAKREQSRHSSAVTLTPPLESFSPTGLPLPIQCQGPADCCPLSSIKAISVEVTRACRFTQGKSPRWPTPELFFFSIHGLCWSQDWGDRTQLSLTCQSWVLLCLCSVDITHPHYGLKSMNIILHCLHDNDSGKVASHLCWWICMYRVGVA